MLAIVQRNGIDAELGRAHCRTSCIQSTGRGWGASGRGALALERGLWRGRQDGGGASGRAAVICIAAIAGGWPQHV